MTVVMETDQLVLVSEHVSDAFVCYSKCHRAREEKATDVPEPCPLFIIHKAPVCNENNFHYIAETYSKLYLFYCVLGHYIIYSHEAVLQYTPNALKP